jgi:molecular chaperone GrpE
MKKEEKILENEEMSAQDVLNDEPTVPNDANAANDANDETPEESEVDETEALKERIAELEDKNLRMMAEFDNYRRRTNKEKLELMATAGERIFTEMLPLVDDFERAVAVMDKTNDIDAVREGIHLIQQKFIAFLDKQDVHAIETEGVDFNTDEHEAVTTFAAGEEQKGKVIDCTQKGYKLGEKVIRFAKVVVGE